MLQRHPAHGHLLCLATLCARHMLALVLCVAGCESDALDRIHDALTQEEQREMLEELLSETE